MPPFCSPGGGPRRLGGGGKFCARGNSHSRADHDERSCAGQPQLRGLKWPNAGRRTTSSAGRSQGLSPMRGMHGRTAMSKSLSSRSRLSWMIAIVVDEAGGIIAGHGRVMAAHRLGIEDIPVMVAAAWSDAKKRAYMLADNQLTLNGEWDLDRLAIEIAELRASDFDISLIGFSESEIDDLLKADDGGDSGPGSGSLAERFMIPPFSVLNAREGWWQKRP